MTDPRARRGLPERWLLPPAPREPELRERWDALGFDRRRELARVRAEGVAELDTDDTEVVGALARARLATSWRLLLSAPLYGWFTLMSFWGFGRASFPDQEAVWLQLGLVLGAVVWLAMAIAVARRLRRARTTAGTAVARLASDEAG